MNTITNYHPRTTMIFWYQPTPETCVCTTYVYTVHIHTYKYIYMQKLTIYLYTHTFIYIYIHSWFGIQLISDTNHQRCVLGWTGTWSRSFANENFVSVSSGNSCHSAFSASARASCCLCWKFMKNRCSYHKNHSCVNVCVRASVYQIICVQAYMYIYIYIYLSIYPYLFIDHLFFIPSFICLFMCLFIYLFMYYVCTYVCMHLFIHLCVCAYRIIHTYVCDYIHIIYRFQCRQPFDA